MRYCPMCGSRSIGRVGTDQYFCWDCYVECRVGRKNGEVKMFFVTEDGGLVEYQDAVNV